MWTRARLIDTDDIDWAGRLVSANLGPGDGIFRVGVPGGATIHSGGKISVMVGWCVENGDFVEGAGTITPSLVHIQELEPFAPGQVIEIMAVSQTKIDRPGWEVVDFDAFPGRYSVHLTAMAPPLGATHVGLWYWSIG